ncbi:histidinol dehydrogenase [Paenibacillus sp. GD4]|uniref:histidinol dehydrogenase n=1 Tax=Paenibacillus sp. GD4 TaxID=3068890 RepID=UPI002796B05D|nr:histidinol dehydrogenase [Paenibacillus sp. GD4]MDQ1910510.1 histidinol dehydrogenase [Paenibacillus sp. GD4]
MNQLSYVWPSEQEALEQRLQDHKVLFGREVLAGVLDIFDEVVRDGDAAVRCRTLRHDQVGLTDLRVSDAYVEECLASLSPAMRSAVERAILHIRQVNEELLPVSWEKELRPGTIVGEKVTPLGRVGIWIPARKGPLVSTALMLVAAAKVAGVGSIVVGMPPLANGLPDPGTVAGAKLAGADAFVVGNGVAVIAGFAVGTETIPEADGIFGPGPGGIAAAMSVAMTYGKKSALGLGPTECAIIADETADPLKLACDLISEAEHGADSAALLVTTSMEQAKRVEEALRLRIAEIEEPRRSYLQQVFGPAGKGAMVVAPDVHSGCGIVDTFAPEHLMIAGQDSFQRQVLGLIQHAGEILLGGHTPFSAANYAIGITAVLPTNRYAKAFSGVTARDMVKTSMLGKLSEGALQELYPIIETLGAYEQLPCHIAAAGIRVKVPRESGPDFGA